MVRNEQILKDILLKMNYDPSKTLSEQLQSSLGDISGLHGPVSPPTEPTEEEIANTYPNYCRYSDMAHEPPKVDGNSGLINDLENGIRYCYYYSPSTKKVGSVEGLHVPEDTYLEFFGDVAQYSQIIDFHMSEFVTDDEEKFTNLVTKIFPPGTVSSIGGTYKGWMTRPAGSDTDGWIFKGYVNANGEWYENPEWIDNRTAYQRFIDEWGFWLQLGAAIVTAIAGAFTGGAAWVLTAEIILEMGIGLAVGLREIEKGNNVAAAFSFLTGALPLLKTLPAFRGVSAKLMGELADDVLESGLNQSSSVDDYVKFYRSLKDSPAKQELLTKILTQDEISRNALIKIVSNSDNAASVIINGTRKALEANPKELLKLAFWDKLWARELTTNGVVGVLGLGVEFAFGKQLNDAELQKVSEIYSKIPEQHTKEFIYNLMINGDKITEILDNLAESEDEASKFIDTEATGQAIANWYNANTKKAVEDAGGTYVELSDDSSTTVPDVTANRKRDVKTLRDEGWVPQNELGDREWETIRYVWVDGESQRWFKLQN